MPNQFPSIDTVKISDIRLINIPSRRSSYSVKISNGGVTEQLPNQKVDGNSIVWPDSLSFTGTDLADQSVWYFKVVKTWLVFTKTVGSQSYKLEEKFLDLLQSQKDHGCCKLTVFKGCQLRFTIERLGEGRDALPELVNDVENALAQMSTLKRPVEIANFVMKTDSFIESEEDPWMSFLPNFKIFMSTVDTIAEIHPYVQLAWSILSIIPKTIISQNERDDSINKLSRRLKEVFEYITDAKRLPTFKETQRKTLSILVQQTIECAYFLKEYAALDKASKILKGVNIDEKVGDFNKNFDHIMNVMANSTVLEINIVTLRTSNDISELREKLEELNDFNLLEGMPRAENPGFLSLKACLPGTRQALITEIIHWVNAGDDSSQRVFLLLGQAGMGKSAVAHTISQIFRKQNRLGSLFCFSQSYKDSRSRFFSTITRELADGDVQWRKRLVKIIEETRIRTSLDTETQFDELIINPSKVVKTIGPVVIIIDGLDESGDRGERAVLLDLLFKRSSELPSNYRFVITSRPEPDIEPLTKHPTVFCKRMADIDPTETTKDIQEYISSRLNPVENILNQNLNINWQLILAKRAESLFQWAKLACDVINPTVEFGVASRARKFISGSTSSLYQVYNEIFLSRPEFEEEGYLPAFKTVMSALVIMRRPLSIHALQALFQNDFPHKIESMMAPFHSLFLGTNDLHTPIRPLHTSLTDFLTTRSIEVVDDTKQKKNILNQFYVDTSDQGPFTLACLKLMNGDEGGLRFNICNLETSHLRNRDVPGLDDRVQKEIPLHLSYASYFWAVHLQQSKVSEGLLIQLRLLMCTNVLYLFEILSLLDKSVDQVCVFMKFLVDWCRGIDVELASQAEDACQFGYNFGHVIAESTPHLYISALPFAPNGSFIRDQYLDLFPHHFNIEFGQSLGPPRNSNVMKRHPNSFPTDIVFSPQGRYIATGFDNGDFWLWDYKTGEVAYQWKTDEWEPKICTIVFSPNGESVTLCLLNGSFKILNIAKNELVSHSYGVFKEPCKYSTISGDGHYLVFHSSLEDNDEYNINSSLEDNEEDSLYNVNSPLQNNGEVSVYSVNSPLQDNGEVSLYDVTSHSTTRLGFLSSKSIFSPNGELLASIEFTSIDRGHLHKIVSIWSIQKRELIELLCPDEVEISNIAFSPDGNHMALLCDSILQLWDVLTLEKVHELEYNRIMGGPEPLIFSSDGQNLLFHASFGIQFMDISTGVLTQSLPPNGTPVALAVSSDCKHLAAALADGVIQVQECESTPRRAKPVDDRFQYYHDAMFSPLNTYLLVQNHTPDSTTYLQILNTATMTTMARARLQSCNLVTISPNDEYIAYATIQGLCLWSDKGGESVLGTSQYQFTALAFSFGGDCLISSDSSGAVSIWNIHTRKLFCPSYTVMHSKAGILALAFSRTGMQFLVMFESNSNQVIEIRSSESGNLLRGPFIGPSIPRNQYAFGFEECILTFSANETHIVCGLFDITFIMDARTGQTLKIFKRTPYNYMSCDRRCGISPDSKYIVVAGGTSVEVWDIDTGEAIDGKWRDCSAIRADFSNSSNKFATREETGEINFWDITSGNKLAMPTFNCYHEGLHGIVAMNDEYLVLDRLTVLEVWSLETHQNVSHHQYNGQKSLTSSVDYSKIELSDGAIQDQERTEYALVAWKKALFSELSYPKRDGWVEGPSGELLFWVPKERRKGLWKPKMVHLMGQPITKLSFDNFVHSSRWTECKEKL